MDEQKINDDNIDNNGNIENIEDNVEDVLEASIEDIAEINTDNINIESVDEVVVTSNEEITPSTNENNDGLKLETTDTSGHFDSSQIDYGEVKKSKKGIGCLGAAGIVVLILVAVGVGFFIWYLRSGSSEFYKVGGEEIPTINQYLGRNITPSSLEKGVEASDDVDDHSYYYVSYSSEDVSEDDFFNYIGDVFTEDYFVWYDILEDGNYSHLTAVKDNGNNIVFIYFSGGETDFYIDIMVYTETEQQRQYFEEIKQSIESYEELEVGEEIESEESSKP